MGISGISIWQLLVVFFGLLVILPLYFLPTLLALYKNHPHKIPIVLVNVFGGVLGGLGWVIALVWCFITPAQSEEKSEMVLSDLEKLHALKETGVLTQEEFDQQKRRMLNI